MTSLLHLLLYQIVSKMSTTFVKISEINAVAVIPNTNGINIVADTTKIMKNISSPFSFMLTRPFKNANIMV